MNILIVEDEEILARVIKEELEAEGFKTEVVGDGEAALKALKSSAKFDLVLLDLILPVRDGFSVLEEMSGEKFSKWGSTPVIVLSNLGQDDDIKRALKLGVVDYFIKSQHPIDEVIGKIKSFLKRDGAVEQSIKMSIVKTRGSKSKKASKKETGF